MVEASKASSGNITLEMNDLDFVEMVQQVIGEFEERFQEKNLVMMVHFTDEPSVIYADGQRMWRVLENIFGNVVKYAMEGTRVYAEDLKADKKITFSLKKHFRTAAQYLSGRTHRALYPRRRVQNTRAADWASPLPKALQNSRAENSSCIWTETCLR